MSGNYSGANYGPGTGGAASGSAALKGGSGDKAPTKTPIDYRTNANWLEGPGGGANSLCLYAQVT